MIIDYDLILDSAAAVTTTRDSTQIIDLTLAEDIGDGEVLEVIVEVATTFGAAADTL